MRRAALDDCTRSFGDWKIAEAAQAIRPSLKVPYTSGYSENAIVHHSRLDPGVSFPGKPYR